MTRRDDDVYGEEHVDTADVQAATLLSWAAAACVVGFWSSVPFALYAHQAIEAKAVKFLSIMVIPFFLLLWIVLTIKAMHRIGLYFFSLSSTYWAGASLLFMVIGLVVIQLVDQRLDTTTLLLFAAICVGTIGFVFVLNYRASGLFFLSFVVTTLQFTVVFWVLFAIFSWNAERQRKDRRGSNGDYY